MDAQPWPRLLACWRDGRLNTVLLHADGRRAHARDEAIHDGAQLAPALADALAALHRPVHHAVLMTDTELAADTLSRRLGLATLCTVPWARALRLAPEDEAGWTGAARALDLALHTPASGAVCAQIRGAYAHLTRCERRVADVVLANPSAALETATAKLADAAQVSQPQVIRFCRALGFDGVKGFKRALAESLAVGDDDSAPAGHPLLARSTRALRGLDRSLLGRAAETLARAAQIEILADPDRAPLCELALQTLWRAGLPARPRLAGDRPATPAVCLALGTAAAPSPGASAVWITETAQAGTALQLVTGSEAESAPSLLATLTLQLLLADVGQSLTR